ncbi:hypothetical protein [Roseibium aggregatum]|uniref:hypothetical protein n=1 Tax=Roseibium aggregatum TaxID=187304 RepID=UPI000683518C|nr:hypothetical protein [Roseibium aggregatum]
MKPFGTECLFIAALFVSLLNEPGDDSVGCLLTNSAIEFAGGACPAEEDLERGFSPRRNAFEEFLLPIPDFNAEKASSDALHLLVFYQGLLVMIRNSPRPAPEIDPLKNQQSRKR